MTLDCRINLSLSLPMQPHRVYVDEPCRIHKRPRVAPEVAVISLSIKKTLDLLHVCYPIDFCVFLDTHKGRCRARREIIETRRLETASGAAGSTCNTPVLTQQG